MNILIINAFGTSIPSKSKFTSFCNSITTTFKRISNKLGTNNFTFIYKTPSNLDEFIYDPDFNPLEGTKVNITNKKNFDKIDMVFIDGSEKYLPWEHTSYKLSLFIYLCKITNKILYAGGVALEILIYYLATGTHSEFTFINSKGEIQSLEEIHLIPQEYINDLKKNEFFLDFVTGDVLQYKTFTKSWESIVNIGLHKQIAAEKYMSRGKFVLATRYNNKDSNNKTIISNCMELKVSIIKQFLSHWLVKNIANEFACFTTLTWFPHYINVSYEKFQYYTICESNKGPIVVEHDNSIGVAFHVNSRYKYTEILLENFIQHYCTILFGKIYNLHSYTQDTLSLPTENEEYAVFKSYKLNDEIKLNELAQKTHNKVLKRPLSFIEKINNSRAFGKKLKVKKNAAYCGMSLSNRHMIFVENNSINQRPVSSFGINYFNSLSSKQLNTISDSNDLSKSDKEIIKPNENTRISSLFKLDKEYMTTSSSRASNPIRASNSKRRNTIDNLNRTGKLESHKLHKAKEHINQHEQYTDEYLSFINKEKMGEEQMIDYYKRLRREICKRLEEINTSSYFKEKKTLSFMSKKKPKYNNNVIKLFSRKNEMKNNKSDNSLLIPSYNNKYVSMYPYMKKHSSVKEIRIPISTDNSIGVTDGKCMTMGSEYNGKKKEVIRLNLFRKTGCNYNKLWKQYDSNYNTNNTTNEGNSSSKEKYENIYLTHKFREVFPSKWLNKNGFVV